MGRIGQAGARNRGERGGRCPQGGVCFLSIAPLANFSQNGDFRVTLLRFGVRVGYAGVNGLLGKGLGCCLAFCVSGGVGIVVDLGPRVDSTAGHCAPVHTARNVAGVSAGAARVEWAGQGGAELWAAGFKAHALGAEDLDGVLGGALPGGGVEVADAPGEGDVDQAAAEGFFAFCGEVGGTIEQGVDVVSGGAGLGGHCPMFFGWGIHGFLSLAGWAGVTGFFLPFRRRGGR